MSKAAQQVAASPAKPTPPPHTFILGVGAFTDAWKKRPDKPVRVGLRRIPAEDRLRCDAEAIKRADLLLPPHRRHREDPVWQRVYEVTFIHYLIACALCDPLDVNAPLWPAQDGLTFLLIDPESLPDRCPVSSARFTDNGIGRIFDEMDLLARADKVARALASDEELVAVGKVLADGSFFARLQQADTDEARAVGEHVRMLAGAMLEVMERGREAPLPMGR